MKLIVGLGNPEVKYINTRHNVGHMVIDQINSEKLKVKNFKALKSDKYMNNSGSFVFKKLKAYNIRPEALYVVHDDLDIPLGAFKIQFGTGPKVHNGLNDIYEKIGTSDFWHVRVGIDNRTEDQRQNTEGKDYVLEDLTIEEMQILNNIINKLCFELIEKLKIDKRSLSFHD